MARSFTTLEGDSISKTLVQRLTPTVDAARDIATRLGARPYRVTLVWVKWSGAKRSEGVPTVEEMPLLPTPKVVDLNSLQVIQNPIGGDMVGMLRVSEISPRYTEDQLNGNGEGGTPKPPNWEFFWEIEFRTAHGPGSRRRFIPKSTPQFHAERAEWTVDVLKTSADRPRSGSVI